MRRAILALLSLFLGSSVGSLLPAQDLNRDQFRTEFTKSFTGEDDKGMDRAMKRGAQHAALYFEELCVEKLRGKDDLAPKIDAMRKSWERAFGDATTMEKVHRWVDGMSSTMYDALQRGRTNAQVLWRMAEEVFKAQLRDEYLKIMAQYVELARNAEQIGHAIEAAEMWGMAGVVGNKVPGKSLADRKEVLFATRQFLMQREAWGFVHDGVYLQSQQFAKHEEPAIVEAEKAGEKRTAEGYDANAKGIDTYLMPNAAEAMHALQFEALTAWENELDYGPKNGPVPALWWNTSLGKVDSSRKLDWFRRREVFVVRLGAAKFGITIDPLDLKKVVEIDVSNKAKPTTFWLDLERKVPYAMFFWGGSDKERIGEADINMLPTQDFANVYYRSASSWKTAIGADAVVFYDDNANGRPCDSDPFEPDAVFRVHTLGDHDGEGTQVPLFDSMRIGKGPRVPYSEFVQFGGQWFHMRRGKLEDVGLRPLNPEYFKTGKLKFVWTGPKPTAPVQLVVQGAGDFKTAFFDVAHGKEIDVPAGNYAVVFGRIAVGKGVRVQMATVFRGTSKEFAVEAGKVHELKMGAPFTMEFERRGDDDANLDALKIQLHEASGCVLANLHNMALWPEVLAAKSDDGKGAKVVGKFLRFTDPELVNKASAKHNNLGTQVATFPMPEGYRDGEMVLKLELPAPGMKLALSMKKHPVFGVIGSPWR
jgi:hypothetical protein